MEKNILLYFYIDEIDYNRLINPKCLNDVEYLALCCSSITTYSELSTILTTYYSNVRSLQIDDFELTDNDSSNSSPIITRTLNYVKFVKMSCQNNLTCKYFPKILRLIPNLSSLSIEASDLDFPAMFYNTPEFCNKIKCLELNLKFTKVNLSQTVIYFDKLERLRLYFFKYGYDNNDTTITRLEYDENDLDLFCFILIESKTLLSADIAIYNIDMRLTL
ncbi:unnamed protein product [Didymodactylos carnosus]|uniref:Uncharacterized protein n=2 Tax=Didymodactylos carnosus TaxID=1234261 RepID=A0A816B8B9_9BILA|nr:unnamed protein product [Didymodactylos carnosus]CAF4489097.1 unnamed protein product [Didymodactylos carnosus]